MLLGTKHRERNSEKLLIYGALSALYVNEPSVLRERSYVTMFLIKDSLMVYLWQWTN